MLNRRNLLAASAVAAIAMAPTVTVAGAGSYEAEFAALVTEAKILDNGTAHGISDDEWEDRWDRYEARRNLFLDSIEALPETPENIMPRALAFALIHALDMNGLEDEDTTDSRLATGIVRSALNAH